MIKKELHPMSTIATQCTVHIGENKFKSAWEELRRYVNEISEIDPDGSISTYQIREFMNRLMPPSRVYNPDTEWVPANSGQLPETFERDFIFQDNLDAQLICHLNDLPSFLEFMDFNEVIAWRNSVEPYKGEE